MRIFLTGTDTGIGKTRTARLLVEAWDRAHPTDPLTPLKPLCSGEDSDLRELSAATQNRLPPAALCHTHWKTPAAPSVAATVEARPLDREAMLAWVEEQSRLHRRILLEAVGGWLAPVQGTWCVADWAEELRWPVLLVVGNRLGAINHTLLTVRDIERRQLPLLGIILNEPQSDESPEILASNETILREDFGLPVWGRLPLGSCDIPPDWPDYLGHPSPLE